MTALDLLRQSLTPAGFLASPTERANYRRVWARDGVVCGVAGLASGDAALADGLRRTLDTLAAHVGPQGQIPSNVAVGPDGAAEAVSYGGLAGRVDAGLWVVLGVALYARHADAPAFAARHASTVDGVLRLLDAWEFNARGLVYVPQSGDWADEYDLHGYLLYDQVLRLVALRAWAPWAPDGDRIRRQADRLQSLVEATFWPHDATSRAAAYSADAIDRALADGPAAFPFAAFAPGGYARRFDALGTALALAFDVAWTDRAPEGLAHGEALAEATSAGLVPAFWPPVTDADPAWAALRANVRDGFSNRPGHYHNGGLWPFVNGWWGAALARHGEAAAAAALADRIDAANALPGDGPGPGFYEYLDARAGAPHGTRHQAWSAAGAVLVRHALDGGALFRLADGSGSGSGAGNGRPGPEPTVVVAGEVLVDLISAEPVASLGAAERFERHAGGSPANLASNLARLGTAVTLVGAVGEDGLGQFLQREAERVGVRARLAVRAEAPTSLVTVARSAGTPDFALYREADRLLTPDQFPDALLRSARLFHTSGFALALDPARATLLDAAARAAAHGTPLSVDLNVAPRTDRQRAETQAAVRCLLALGPLVKCSRDDAARLWAEPLSDAEVVAHLHRLGAGLVCLTRGAEGTLVSWDGGAHRAEVPAAPVAAIADATGAGDAFWAGFLAAWLGGQAPPACARAGGRLAARKLAHAGPLPRRVDAASVLTP